MLCDHASQTGRLVHERCCHCQEIIESRENMSLNTAQLILKSAELRERARRDVNSAPPRTWDTEERYCNNDSLDSGVAGLRDPQFSSNKNSDTETSEYIVDPSTRTTYLKGKFLGKVRKYIIIYYRACCVLLISKPNSTVYVSLFSFIECFNEIPVEQ